jgi:GNAT superfamily N-acetyltransferase
MLYWPTVPGSSDPTRPLAGSAAGNSLKPTGICIPCPEQKTACLHGPCSMDAPKRQVALERFGPYTLRAAELADLNRLIELLLALQDHIEASNPSLWRMEAETRTNLRGQISARLQAADSCALVAEHKHAGVIGVIFGRIIVNNRYTPSRAGQIDQAFVRADHRRAGVGSRLVAGLCHFFADRGIEDVSLRYVMGNEEAASFWSALGFAPRIVTTGARRRAVEERLETLLKP